MINRSMHSKNVLVLITSTPSNNCTQVEGTLYKPSKWLHMLLRSCALEDLKIKFSQTFSDLSYDLSAKNLFILFNSNAAVKLELIYRQIKLRYEESAIKTEQKLRRKLFDCIHIYSVLTKSRS